MTIPPRERGDGEGDDVFDLDTGAVVPIVTADDDEPGDLEQLARDIEDDGQVNDSQRRRA